jgi:hypothetical protein
LVLSVSPTVRELLLYFQYSAGQDRPYFYDMDGQRLTADLCSRCKAGGNRV